MIESRLEAFRRLTPPSSLPRTFSEAIGYGTSANHAFFAQQLTNAGDAAIGELADIVHFLCLLHGSFPGVIEQAMLRSADLDVRDWLTEASAAMVRERALLRRLTVTLGPGASTLFQDQCNAAILQLNETLASLAQSERRGCAVGAAFAFALDWAAIHDLLVAIGKRTQVDALPCKLPPASLSQAHVARLSDDRFVGRAMAFGAAELLLHHRLFWDILAERKNLRDTLARG